jgi:hypothetical protein
VLDRVLDLLGRDLDGQADAVLAEVFDDGGHAAIQPAWTRVAADRPRRRRQSPRA